MWYCRFMASRNALKVDIAEQYYHVYNRGVEKRIIFVDDSDYSVFLNLIKRYLDKKQHVDARKIPYPWLKDKVELLAYCLMPNHFHLLLYQTEEGAMKTLMQSVCSAYTRYFNNKYLRVGHLFQGVYKASRISTDAYVQHISRYIHLNPADYRGWEYSSLPYYMGSKHAEWVRPARILQMFDSLREYDTFLKDYEGQRQILNDLKHELANGL